MRCLLLVPLLFATLFAAPTFAQDKAAQSQMEKGVKLFSQKKYAEAALAYQKALELAPDAAGPHRELGKCYEALKEFDLSIHHLTEYLSRRPEAQERPDIEEGLTELRTKLPREGKALLSVSLLPGATVFVSSSNQEPRGIGTSPISKHPIDTRFTTVKLLTPSETIELPISLLSNQETIVAERPKTNSTPTIETTPPTEPTSLLSKPTPEKPVSPPKEPSTRRLTPLLGASALSGLGALGCGVTFQFTVRSMERKLQQIEELEGIVSPFEGEHKTLLEDLKKQSTLAKTTKIVGWSLAGASALTAALGLALPTKKKEAKLMLGPGEISAAFAF